MPNGYEVGDRHRASQEFQRVHRPICVVQRGDCGCSFTLVPQTRRYFINDSEVGEQQYRQAQAEYLRVRDLGQAP